MLSYTVKVRNTVELTVAAHVSVHVPESRY